ncbi:MAG: AIR synthase related protein [Vallitaleaceae bacterium]|jgi:hypothetical protein|nr:AIR synthase related protein [Vallitaleaceae bacterium]
MSLVQKYRDVQLIEWGSGHYLAIACDVSAYIGSKDDDVVKVDPVTAGYYATVVPVMELLSIGARPISVIDTLGVEMDPTGKEIIQGVRNAMVEAGIAEDCLTGSTEDNMPSRSTTVGVTVVAELEKELLKSYKPMAGQEVWLVGLPKMGQIFLQEEIQGGKGEVITISVVKEIRLTEGVGHMLPIGSKGIGAELKVLLAVNDLDSNLVPLEIDFNISAGPSSCMLITCNEGIGIKLKETLAVPINYVGELEKC